MLSGDFAQPANTSVSMTVDEMIGFRILLARVIGNFAKGTVIRMLMQSYL